MTMLLKSAAFRTRLRAAPGVSGSVARIFTPGRSFFDTNVLVYTDDADSPAKREVALDLVESHRRAGTGVVSNQVLQEYFVASTRKLKVDAAIARRKVALFARFPLVPLSVDDLLAAIDIHRLNPLSFWDALIVRAAIASGCVRLYSEDLQTGARYDGVEVVNPFRSDKKP
jgi:predicted nucleic acid-binding protein